MWRFLALVAAIELALAGFDGGLERARGALTPGPPPTAREPMQRTSAPASLVVKTPPPATGSPPVLPSPAVTPAPKAPAKTTPSATAAATSRSETARRDVAAAKEDRPAATSPTVAAIAAARSTATTAPAPVAAPAPARPFRFPYDPPLSVEEAIGLLRTCIDILAIRDDPTRVGRCQRVAEMIDAVRNYLTVLDQRRSAVAAYDWHFIDREKVDGPGPDRDTFLAEPVLPKISAISFAADFGDVFIYSVSVSDISGGTTTFTLNRLIEENYPHREICYLFFPTTVRSVDIRYQARGDSSRTPRLAVFAGVAREEEYLKQTLWYLRNARRETETAVQSAQMTTASLEAANDNLRRAAGRLIQYRVRSR